MYKKYIKRVVDILCALAAIVVFWWLYVIIAILVKIKIGSPVLFKQARPGKDGKVFYLYKFRTMTNETDSEGNLLPDEQRLLPFGRFLRSSSLDELPEAFNILKGDMSVVGPRPQLVRDMVFMTEEEKMRHSVRPGLTGLAQVSGRNNISWEEKFYYDAIYIKNITFVEDIRIIFATVWKAFFKQENIDTDGMATAEDLGDYLLRTGKISESEYDECQTQAKLLIGG